MSDEPKREMSKTQAKKLINLSRATIAQIGSAAQRNEKDLAEQSRAHFVLQRQHANAMAIIEAFVRRHGPTIFDRQTVQSICARGAVVFDVAADRITVRLRPGPVAVDTDADVGTLIDMPEEPT